MTKNTGKEGDYLPKKYPNQKEITVHKEPCDLENIYTKINKKAMFQAMKNYSGRKAPSFELWCYIASSQPGRVFVLSPEAIKTEIGMKEDAYRNAVNNLIDDGYLVLKNDETNTRFDFYEIPRKKKEGDE